METEGNNEEENDANVDTATRHNKRGPSADLADQKIAGESVVRGESR